MRKTIITGLVWSAINIGAILCVKHGDTAGWNEILLAVLAIPVGLINCAVLFNSFYRLRKFNSTNVVYSLFGLANAAFFFVMWNDLYYLSGSL